jgi:hypothetical protein
LIPAHLDGAAGRDGAICRPEIAVPTVPVRPRQSARREAAGRETAGAVQAEAADRRRGYLPLEPDAAHLFFQLVSRRYETGAMLITSNRSVAEWSTVFADPVVATAILDRLLHHSHVLTIRGDSYRLRASERAV